MKYQPILDELRRRELAKNRMDFATDWLGYSYSYAYKLDERHRGELPLEAMWRLAVRLERAGQADLAARVRRHGDDLAAAA